MVEPHEQLMISRAAGGDATSEEWRELERLADADPAIWRQLAQAQRDQAALDRLMRVAADRAEAVTVELDTFGIRHSEPGASVAHSIPHATLATLQRQVGQSPPGQMDPRHLKLNRLGAWTGWAAAALIALIASVQNAQQGHLGGGGTGPSQAGSVGVQMAGPSLNSAAHAFQTYLEKGRESGQVVGEVPTKVLLDSRPVATGHGYEVIFLRQVMERAIVPDLYRFTGQDESGRPVLTRYEKTLPNSM